MRPICVWFVVVVVTGCDREPKPAPSPPAATVRTIDARPIDAAALDAPVPKAPACDSSARAFRFGTITAPSGWCWRRTEEGDDQSGDLVDASGAKRARYTELSFGEPVGDPCADAKVSRDAHEQRAGKLRYRTCELVADGRHCAAFHGAANLCAPDAATLVDLVKTLAPK